MRGAVSNELTGRVLVGGFYNTRRNGKSTREKFSRIPSARGVYLRQVRRGGSRAVDVGANNAERHRTARER